MAPRDRAVGAGDATIITGQSSALLLLCVVGAATLWTRGNVILACALLGLLAIKPNWGIVFGLLALVRGEWKGAATMAGIAALLCLLTLPLGRELWTDFLGASDSAFSLAGETPRDKQITVRAFLEATLGSSRSGAACLWTLAAVGIDRDGGHRLERARHAARASRDRPRC